MCRNRLGNGLQDECGTIKQLAKELKDECKRPSGSKRIFAGMLL
jgi:hypothetical protein